ncbi:hypothetical protein [Asaia astilbis]|uniref:hypothetical protein n=1 Tax=Asaia astilbis TaxID=610244 RepID=UPI0004705957|nr:hypothetical protein [Asaia astilbis]
MIFNKVAAISLVAVAMTQPALSRDFRFESAVGTKTIDEIVNNMNRKVPLIENKLATIIRASREDRTLVEEIELTPYAEEAINNFSADKFRRVLYDATLERYCYGTLKLLSDTDVSLKLIFYRQRTEFYRVFLIPVTCTIVN